MGRIIAKLADNEYIEWSSVVDAPVSRIMPRDKAIKTYSEDWVVRADKYGTSSPLRISLKELLQYNHAGPDGEEINLEEIRNHYASLHPLIMKNGSIGRSELDNFFSSFNYFNRYVVFPWSELFETNDNYFGDKNTTEYYLGKLNKEIINANDLSFIVTEYFKDLLLNNLIRIMKHEDASVSNITNEQLEPLTYIETFDIKIERNTNPLKIFMTYNDYEIFFNFEVDPQTIENNKKSNTLLVQEILEICFEQLETSLDQ